MVMEMKYCIEIDCHFYTMGAKSQLEDLPESFQ